MDTRFSKRVTFAVIFGSLFFAFIFFSLPATFAEAQFAPDAPQNILATTTLPFPAPDASSSCALSIRWDQTGTLLSTAFYEIYRNTTRINNVPVPVLGPVSFVDQHGPLGAQFANPIIDPTLLYTYRIRACNASDCSTAVSSLAVRTPGLPNIPQVPVLTRAEGAIENYQVFFEWRVPPRLFPPATSTLFSTYGGFAIEERVSTNGGMSWGSWQRVGRVDANGGTLDTPWSRPGGFSISDIDKTYAYRLVTQEVGGLGCDYLRIQHRRESAFGPSINGIILPTRPNGLQAVFNKITKVIELSWQDNSTSTAQENFFDVWRKVGGSDWTFLKGKGALGRNATSTTDVCPENQNCSYVVRACKDPISAPSQPAACSITSNEVLVEAALAAPTNLAAQLVYVSTSTQEGLVRLGWEDNSGTEDGFAVERSASGGPFQDVSAQCAIDPINDVRGTDQSNLTECYDTAPLNDVYSYRVKAYKSGVESPYSNVANANLAIQMVLKGQGWSAFPLSPEGTGVGWVSFNSDTVDAFGNLHSPAGYAKYSVQADENGLMSGAAFANVNWDSGFPAGFGWFSFNESDLAGCPSYQSLPCAARYSPSTGEVSGWARFVGPLECLKRTQNDPRCTASWDGFVNLRGTIGSGAPPPPPPPPPGPKPDPIPLEGKKDFDLKIFASAIKGFQAGMFEPFTSFIKQASAQVATLLFQGELWSNRSTGWIAVSKAECKNVADANITCDVSAERITLPPRVSNIQVQTLPNFTLWCDPSPFYRVIWNFDDGDPNGTYPQVAAEINFYDANDSTLLYSAQTTSAQVFDLRNPLETLGVSPGNPRDFFIEIRAQTSSGIWSSWTRSPNTTTPTHYPSIVDFTWEPIRFAAKSQVTFTASTTDRSGGAYPITDYLWNFIDATPTPVTGDPAVVNAVTSTIGVALDVTDSDGTTCSVQGSAISSSTTSILRRIFRER